MSALGDDEERPPEFWVKSLGVDDYVRKPFDPLDLLGRVEYLFRRNTYVSAGAPQKSIDPLQGDAEYAPAPDHETRAPIDVRKADPETIVRSFIECWNAQDFATEYHCMDEEMTGGMAINDYVTRRRQTYMEEKGQGRIQRLVEVLEEKISINVAKIVVEREDTINGVAKSRREVYTLKKTGMGWKIIGCRSVRNNAPTQPPEVKG